MPARAEKSVRTSVLLPKEAYDRVQEIADANDVSAAWVIRQAVLQFLQAHRAEARLPMQKLRGRR